MVKTRSEFAARLQSQIYLFLQIALGAATLVTAVVEWHSADPARLVTFALAAVFGSVLKLRLPGVLGEVSVSAPFILVAIVNLGLPEAVLVALLSALVQSTWRTSYRAKLAQTAFNVSVFASAVFVTGKVFQSTSPFPEPLSFAALALTYFCVNTIPIAIIIGLTERRSIFKIWAGQRWLLPFYVASASLAWLVSTLPHAVQWEFPIICLPLVYLVHRSNRTQVVKMEQERSHMKALNGLHLRTIEALALAIDAKDHTTHDHLQRVQLYAMEIGKDLGLSEGELEALQAASVLHDIGKLAVPESIISKPGKLTRAEFEKMKIHPVVGAEILERVEFPYPVVPIVRSHHEKWDGTGYPYGLRGEEIPIGARILSVVDCLDALASDRQYRRALPLDEAMARILSEAGTAFDPKVVQALQARYQELEERARTSHAPAQAPLSVDIKITKGSAPAAGFETESPAASPARAPAQPRANRRTAGSPGEVAAPAIPEVGVCSLEWDEALLVASRRIRRAISCDALALCACEDDFVRVKLADGEAGAGLGSLSVRQGDGLIGWVAEFGKPILNGNPSVEPGYAEARGGQPALLSALALPLIHQGRTVGVLALYRKDRDAFAGDEMVSMLELCPALAFLMLDREEPATNLIEMASAVRR